MRIADRQRLIVEAIEQHGLLSMHDVSRLVGTSEATVRRDLRQLAAEGRIRRTRGGAVAAKNLSHEPTYAQKATQAAVEKAAIAEAAAAMVSNGDAIALGAGSTTHALAGRLAALEELTDLTVVTNSMLVWSVVHDVPGIHLVLSGGQVRSSTHAVVGPIAEQSLAGLYVQTLFISGNGLTAGRGLSTPDVLAAAVDRQLARSADRVVVLADHTKVGVETMSLTVPVGQIDCLITDDGSDAAEVERLQQAGVEVVVVPAEAADDALAAPA